MRPTPGARLPLLLLLPAVVTAVTFDCSHVRVDGQSFDFSELGGPHSVWRTEDTPPSVLNTTFTIDVCSPLRKTKGVPKYDECPVGTRVCGIETNNNLADNSTSITKVIPIAGEYTSSHGRGLEPQLTRLKNSKSNGDSSKEGVLVELNGGRYPLDKSDGQQQKAYVEFQCDPDRTGLEGVAGDSRDKEDDKDDEARVKRAEDGDTDGEKDGKKKDPKDEPSLTLVSYRTEGEGDRAIGVLRLNWKTKYACEGQTDHKPSTPKSSHWGFFTWFLIIIFMLVAAYLIFGSWLNYNRYGARGWDLLPHGDTIRDLPYLVKDWAKSIVGAVQGHGARGGYSAV
ncbi:hypothetical protein MBLNU459_g4578t1 [Dothideomycetes sp. NU459]